MCADVRELCVSRKEEREREKERKERGEEEEKIDEGEATTEYLPAYIRSQSSHKITFFSS